MKNIIKEIAAIKENNLRHLIYVIKSNLCQLTFW